MSFYPSPRSTKGAPHSIQVDKTDFLNSLYEQEDCEKSFSSLRYNSQKVGMVLQKNKKTVVNGVYIKYFVDENNVTCKPFDIC